MSVKHQFSIFEICFCMTRVFTFVALLMCWVLFFPKTAISGGEWEETIILTDAEGLQVAAELMNAGQIEDAEKIYNLLRQSKNPTISNEAAFILSQLCMGQEKYDEAIELLIGILNQYPDLARVRLELARAYFMNEDYDDARFHFELVKGGKDIPPEVIKKVDLFLAAIRQKKDWSFDFALGYVPDSNINQASGNTEECIETPFGLLCRDLEGKQKAHGLGVNATGNYYWKFSKNFGLKNTVGAYITEYDQEEYSDYVFYAASGPRVVYGDAEASLQPTYTRRIYGGESYSESLGMRMDLQNGFGRLILASGARFNKHNYADDYIHSMLKGTEYNIYIQPRLILSNQSFIQAGLDYTRDEARVDMYGSDSIRYSAGVYHFFKHGFSLFLEGSLSDAEYHAEQYYITKNYQLDMTTRRDKVYGFLAELSTNIWEGQGLRPSFRYSYTKRDSNIWTNDYDKNCFDLSLNFHF